MSKIFMIDDDGETVTNDFGSQIDVAARSKGYRVKSPEDRAELNWELNRIQRDWANYGADVQASRSTSKPTTALLELRANIENLRKTWSKIQRHQLAGKALFADAIEKTGRHRVLFQFDAAITSPELSEVISDLTPHKLRRRLPAATGPIPIAPLMPSLKLLLRSLESRLEPIPRTKGTRKVATQSVRCVIASQMLKVVGINFSGQAIRNAAGR